MTNEELDEIGENIEFTKTTRRLAGGGTWVCGKVKNYRFEALVFPEHAECADYEIGDSKISKLMVRAFPKKVGDGTGMGYSRIAYNWDRGLDIAATDPFAQAIVDFLCAGLAEHTYAK